MLRYNIDDSSRTRVFPAALLAVGEVACESGADLRSIRRPDIGLARWRRRPPSALERWLDGLDLRALPEVRLQLAPREVPAALAQALQPVAGDAAGFGLFLADLASLSTLFARLCRRRQVELRLEALHHDACWRFHRDHVALRLLTTYRGPGTEWVAENDAEDALRAQREFAGPLRQLQRFEVGLFKGARSGGGGVVHRSPPIAGSGIGRLLLCLNLPAEPPSGS